MERQSVSLFVDSDRLLRKGAQGLKAAQETFRAEAEKSVRALGAEPLNGPVSVQLTIHAPTDGQQPHMPGVVKAYLDALEGIAYGNDRQVQHLTAERYALDHPMFEGFEPTPEQKTGASIHAVIDPLEAYTALYDRAFRSTWLRRRYSPWRSRWTLKLEADLQRERRLLAANPTKGRDEIVRSLEEEKLRAGVLADIDRPGPLPLAVRALHRVVPIPRLHQGLREYQGSWFLLPLPGQQKGSSASWRAAVDEQISEFKAKRRGWPFDGFVTLDVAVRGQSLEGKDLDNLVHGFLVPFEEQLCVDRGTVIGYRVYIAEGRPEGVQIRVLDHSILLSLSAILLEMQAKPNLEERLQALSDRLNPASAE